MQEREMITITSLLTTEGCEPQLEVHINGSLNVGLSPEKIIETEAVKNLVSLESESF